MVNSEKSLFFNFESVRKLRIFLLVVFWNSLHVVATIYLMDVGFFVLVVLICSSFVALYDK